MGVLRQRTQLKNVTTSQNAGHRKSRQNEKKEGCYRIQKKIQNGHLKNGYLHGYLDGYLNSYLQNCFKYLVLKQVDKNNILIQRYQKRQNEIIDEMQINI